MFSHYPAANLWRHIEGMEMFSGCDAARGMTTCEAHEAIASSETWKRWDIPREVGLKNGETNRDLMIAGDILPNILIY